MPVNRISQLLNEVKSIVIRDREESVRQGKNFNIFYIQGTADDEVRVCRFMKELLDPKGSHGQGAFFLRRFMKIVLKAEEFSEEEYRRARVKEEEVIDHARRIDLVIHINSHRLFPIEVKIYADDQVNQCLDYYHYAICSDPGAKLYYMTLDGHDPSDASRGNLVPGQYERISFSEDILAWLDNCLDADELQNIHSVREILIQFRETIRYLTGRQEGKMMEGIKREIAASYESVMAAVQISKTLPEVKIDLMQKVFDRIKTHMKERGFPESQDCYVKESEEYYRFGRKSYPKVSYVLPVEDKALEDKLALCFQIGESYLYYGIRWINERTDEAAKYVRANPMPTGVREDDEIYYWWKYYDGRPANFRNENEEYYELFKPEGFEKYISGLCAVIDSDLRSYMEQKGSV